MKKLNLYYIVSIITLAFMMFILFRTLQVTGWFEAHHGKSPAERVQQLYTGDYRLKSLEDDLPQRKVTVEANQQAGDTDQFIILLDSLPSYLVKISDFEDEQILVELYRFDSSATPWRMEGCELLLTEDDAENFRGSTIGDFCGLKEQSSEYLALDLLLSGPIVSLEVQTRLLHQADSLDEKKYLLERIDSW
ncbi:MAG: hypothetical protein K9M55_03960 [Candidatus Marinimicrobia bacterium]|nr:hypothetical protein [Candidatus Neomarinimicrobiota bacterium]MCF7921835.1 hypothetical protein [Candidatus Neomarinimicrobiota bacterium]